MAQRNPKVEAMLQDPGSMAAPAFEIVGGVYYVGNISVSCHLIDAGDGLILIDTAYDATVPLLLDSIRSLDFKPEDIQYILNTHWHEDHCGGNRRMKEETGATICLHEADVPILEQNDSFETCPVDRPLRDGDVVSVGDTSVRTVHTPGHTPGGTTFTMETQHEGEAISVVLWGCPGQWTFSPDRRESGYEGDVQDYFDSLRRLRALPTDVWLGAHPFVNQTLEKHGRMDKGSLNPFFDPEGWVAYLDGSERSMRAKFPDA